MEFDTQTQGEVMEVQSQGQPEEVPKTLYGQLVPRELKLKTLGIARYNYFHDAAQQDKVFGIYEGEYLVGRSENSNLVLTNTMFPDVVFTRVSKTQFKIEKDVNDGCGPVYITDLSRNGTFLNGDLIGKNNKRILGNRDSISIVQGVYKVFTFERFGYDMNSEYPDSIQSQYFVGRDLGSGACGVVRLVQDRKTCEMYAMKCIKRNLTVVSAQRHHRGNNDEVNIQREITIMSTVQHPCIIKSRQIIQEEDHVYMVLEYMGGGDLLTRIRNNDYLPEALCKLYFYQMAKGLQYLHKKGITHRDLKPDNILLQSSDTETCVKISDFGLSKLMQVETSMRTMCGTPHYVAPEIVRTQGRVAYTNKVDVWSMGVVLYTMLSGTLPFTETRQERVIDQIINGKLTFGGGIWNRVTHRARSIVKFMMTYDAQKRPSIDEVLEHPWLRDETMIAKANRLMYPNGPPPEVLEERNVERSPSTMSVSMDDRIKVDDQMVYDKNENINFEFTPPAPKRQRVD